MAHHKRLRPKHQRAGCLHCKPYKDERVGGTEALQPSVRRLAASTVTEGLEDHYDGFEAYFEELSAQIDRDMDRDGGDLTATDWEIWLGTQAALALLDELG